MHSSPPVVLRLLPVLCLAVGLAAQEIPKQSPRVSTYRMQVTLDAEARMLTGRQSIRWRNNTDKPTSELRFHLYLNAFRDRESTFMREAGAAFRDLWRKDDSIDEFGWIRLDSIQLVDGATKSSLGKGEYIAPDDGNAADRTVLRVALPRPVAPGASIDLQTEFVARMPKAYRRTGWAPGNVFFGMHWFPKLGVLEDAGWNCHQFHANTEFFADFSRFEVEITVPGNYVVGATGTRKNQPRAEVSAEAQTHVFHQDDVHDFAFVASARHVVHEEVHQPAPAATDPVAVAVAGRMNVDVGTFDLPKTRIILMLLPEHDTATQRERHLTAVKTAIDFYGYRFGPYPYDTITVVDPCRTLGPSPRGLGGGMEYPNLITCGTSLFPHARELRPEGVTVHEFGHQYWYLLSANNEFEESWLDEGINSYSDSRAQDLRYVLGAGARDASAPVQTSSFELVKIAGVGRPVAAGAIPWNKLAAALPAAVRERLEDRISLVPDLPLVQMMQQQPTATFCREAPFSQTLNDRRRFLLVDNPDPLIRRGWEYLNRASYGANSYQRPATLLHVLERLVGRDKWWHFMRAFHAKARFGHPTTKDFVGLLREMCGDDVALFFDGATGPGAVLDYGIDSVRQPPGEPAEVVVRRFGNVLANVQIRFRFAGRQQTIQREMKMTDEQPWRRFVFDADESGKDYGELIEVWVDPPPDPATVEIPGLPAGIYLNDANLLNNAWRKSVDRRPGLYRGVRHMLQVQSRLSHVLIIG